jgi:hypothetical protein
MEFYVVENKQVLEKSTLTAEGLEEILAQELLIDILGICKRKKLLRPNYDGYFSKLDIGDVAYNDKRHHHLTNKGSNDLLMRVTDETFFDTTKDIQNLEIGITNQKILSANSCFTSPKDCEQLKKIIEVNKITRSILDFMGSRYDLKSKVPVVARRCAGIPTPNTELETLEYAIFCKVNQTLFNRTPYLGRRIYAIEFGGEGLLTSLISRFLIPPSQE